MRQFNVLARAALLCGLALVPAAAPAPALALQELRDSDHKELGRILARYLEKLDSPKDAEKARENLREELVKVGKKRAVGSADPLQAALMLTADMGKLIEQSWGYKNLRGGKVEGHKVGARGTEVEYALWLPKTYKATEGSVPLVILVPDTKDGRPVPGDQFLTESWTEPELRDNAALVAVSMPADSTSWTQQFVEDADGNRALGGLSYLMTVYADVRKYIAVDPDRVYLGGRGAGVPVVMKLGSYYPQLFAGVVGRAGDIGEVTWENFQNLPTLLLGAGAQATAFAEKTKQAGYANATVQPEADGKEVWTWMQDHPRVSNPTKVTLFPGSPIPNRSYWLEVPPTDVEPGTYVKGEIDRASNSLKLEGKGVRKVVVYFNDVLLDLDKPIKITLNGAEQQTVVPRSLDEYLNLVVKATSDAGKVYVAVRDFDLPE